MCPEQTGKLKVSTQMTIKIAKGLDFLRYGCPKTMLKYPPRGGTGNFYAVYKRFENNSIWEPDMITGKNAGRRPKILEHNDHFHCSLGLSNRLN